MNRLRIGRGCQIAGVVVIVLALVLLGYLLTSMPRHWPREKHMSCVNNLKQIGLAFRAWAMDNDGQFPFNVSTNAGGTMEFCARGADGFDSNAALHFQVMSNELSTPRLLVCPRDWSREACHRVFQPPGKQRDLPAALRHQPQREQSRRGACALSL